ncbi:MAG: hypothetical protein QM483_05645 [Desulfuromusa sp.]
MVIGELERELITKRVNEGRLRAMAAGVKYGRKPKLSKLEEESLSIVDQKRCFKQGGTG